MARLIVLLTDFGLADPYVGQLKGALLREAPEAVLVDLSHEVKPFNIVQGSFFLAASWRHFAPGTVFLGVVDPGVGTRRRSMAAEIGERWFVGPDNGLAALVLAEAGGAARAYELAAPPASASATFHGRDVFAPAAARIARGDDPASLGASLEPKSLLRGEWAAPKAVKNGVVAHVLHVDRFGNCVLNLPAAEWGGRLAALASLAMTQPRTVPLASCETYGRLPEGGVGLIAGSQGYLELAVNRGSAAARLGLSIGGMVRLAGEDA